MDKQYRLQDAFLDRFFRSRFGPDFYLTGGTALARFYFHHRESLDLDFFTQKQDIDVNEVNFSILGILQALQLTVINQVKAEAFLQYICEDAEKTPLKIDVVRDIPVHFGEFQTRGAIRLDSLENIGSNKVLAIFGRTDAKDFIDLYYILKRTEFSFDHLFSLAQKKDLGLSEFYLAYSVKQIDGITRYPNMSEALDQEKFISFYHDLSRRLLEKIKPKE